VGIIPWPEEWWLLIKLFLVRNEADRIRIQMRTIYDLLTIDIHHILKD
jgi:hypothetical protein